jgi:hypothetical protein
VRLSAAQVLWFAEHGQVPRGVSVPARGDCPAGIRLRDVAGFGLGLSDGDLLVRVGGREVTDRGEVVSLVLAARGRQEKSVEALVLRPRTGCRVGYRVTVEQPYLADDEAPPGLTRASSSLDKSRPESDVSYGQDSAVREARP